jgi:uncharacterized protein (TIRG00374 family)
MPAGNISARRNLSPDTVFAFASMKNLRLLIGVGVAAIALYFTFRDIDFSKFGEALRTANWPWFLPAAAALLGVLVLRTARWAAIMGGTPFCVTFHALNIGYMMNMLLPGRLGEIGRAYVIGARTPVSMPRAISAVVVERLLDLSSVLLMLAGVAPFLPLPEGLVRPAAISGVLLVSLLFAIVLIIALADRVEILLRRLLAHIPSVDAEPWILRFREICAGFRMLGSPTRTVIVLALTAGVWAGSLAVCWCVMNAFLPPSLQASTLVVIVANLGGVVPTPGGLGPAQYFARLALEPFGGDITRGVAFVFVWWIAQMLMLIALGFVGLLQLGLSFHQLSGSARTRD